MHPPPEGTRGPCKIAFTPDGARAVVTETDEADVAVIDTASGKVLFRIPTSGEQPTGVAVMPDGRTVVVTNSFGGSVALLELDTRKTATVALPGAPYDVVTTPDGASAYVSLSQLDQVAVLDLRTRAVTARIAVGRRPRALALTADGKTLAVANMTQGSVTFIEVAANAVIGHGPTPAVNLRGVAIYPDGRRAYPLGQRAQNERPAETAVGVWSNQAFHVRPNGGPNGDENLWLDFLGKDVAEPDSVAFDPQVRRAFITCTGGHSVNVLPLRGSGGTPAAVRGVGACPRGLAFTPDGKELWVANQLGGDIAVINPESLKITRRIPLGPPSRPDPHALGRFLFMTATITRGQQFSCNSCHPDGNTDGISWKFVHVPDAFGKTGDRNVRALRGHIADTAPFRWTGHAKDLESFVDEEVTGLLQGPKLEESQARALAAYVDSLPLPPNPFRQPNGSLTDAALQGKSLFDGKAGCAQCHTGQKAGGQRSAWVGTTPEGVALDVPHLIGVYDSYPYLHDGRARTLEEIFTKHDPQGLHGNTRALAPEELKELIEYVREL